MKDSATMNDSDKDNTLDYSMVSIVEELKAFNIINQARDFSSTNWDVDEPMPRKRGKAGLVVNQRTLGTLW